MKYLFKTKPRKYQYEAVHFLVKRRGVGALLMDPGTGKTKVMIDYLGMLTAKYGSHKALVAAPKSALDTWVDELQKHLGTYLDEDGIEREIPTRVFVLNDKTILEKAEMIREMDEEFEGLTLIVVNHDAFKYRHKVPGLKTVTVQDRMIDAVAKKWAVDIVIVDEIHRLKTHSSNLSKAFKKIAKSVFMRVGLTGTVAPHSPLDVFGQWQFIDIRLFGERWNDFRFYYAIYGGWEGRQVLGFHAHRLKQMKKKLKSQSFVVKKRDALDLPKVTHVTIPVHLESELPYYLEMGKELMVQLPSGKQSISRNTLTKMLRLRQITGGVLGYREEVLDKNGEPVLDKNGIPKEVSRSEDIGDAKIRVMMDKVGNIVEAGKKQVVFAHFRRDVARIVEACNDEFNPVITRGKRKGQRPINVPVFSITGDTAGKSRVRQRKEFYNHKGPAIFVAQMRTVSLAINEFVVASYGHFFSYSQLRDDFIQAMDRLDRSGQTEPVTFYHYIVPHSIDAVILESHIDKTKLEATITKRAKEMLTLTGE